jgi:GT2 family glycosyltransferase
MSPRLFVVIVLYCIRIETCVSYRDLIRAATHLGKDDSALSILLYDNSPEPSRADELPTGTIYHYATRNEGVAGAYNYALQLALAHGSEWLLTLDQDTSLPEHFLVEMLRAASSLSSDTNVAAIVPQVFSDDRMISPHFYAAGAWPRFLPRNFQGKSRKSLFAINSGSLLRVSALESIGGYDPAFWLDASDHVLFARLARADKDVYVLGGLRIQQSLSHLDQAAPLSPARLNNILQAESAFWDSEMTYWAGAMHTLVMLRHLLGMWRRGEDPVLCRLVAASMVDRIVHTRRFRIERWTRERQPLEQPAEVR